MYCCSGCLRPPCGGTLASRPFEHLQQRLLHAFARHVAGDRHVLARLADLVDLVDVEHAALGRFKIEVGGVQQFQQQVLDIFAHVARFGQRRGVANGERHVQTCGPACGPTASCRSRWGQSSRMLDLSISTSRTFGPQHQPLVVAVDRHGQDALGVFLADDVFVELRDDFARRGNLGERAACSCRAVAVPAPGSTGRARCTRRRCRRRRVLRPRVRRRDSSCDRTNRTRSSSSCRRHVDPRQCPYLRACLLLLSVPPGTPAQRFGPAAGGGIQGVTRSGHRARHCIGRSSFPVRSYFEPSSVRVTAKVLLGHLGSTGAKTTRAGIDSLARCRLPQRDNATIVVCPYRLTRLADARPIAT